MANEGIWFYEALNPGRATLEVAQDLGSVVDFAALNSRTAIATVQTLKPKLVSEAKSTQYSGHFGVERFPLHSDLAHWAVPPRYLLLRCLEGSANVTTNVLSAAVVIDQVGPDVLRKAVFSARSPMHHSGLVRALSSWGALQIFRWDSLFLKPMNEGAHRLSNVMVEPILERMTKQVLLSTPGDTILIDNWSVLHGRGGVDVAGMLRHIERVYLSAVKDV